MIFLQVHGEFFGAIHPANTIMQVSGFIDPDWLVEFEADAIADGEAEGEDTSGGGRGEPPGSP
jgi:hypothetical protein